MKELECTNELGCYDVTINVIGGLRDPDIIFRAISSYFNSEDSVKELVLQRNELGLRTERSRMRIERALRQGFLRFKCQDHEDLIQKIFQSNISVQEKELILFWQFSLNNRLFREISTRLFSKVYFSGRANLSKDDIAGYLKDFLNKDNEHSIDWSENTINTLSTKYLNLMTKLDLLNAGRVKSFRHIKPSSESIVLFLYFAKLHEPRESDILKNEMLPLLFVSTEDLYTKLKKLSNKGLFNMDFNGVNLNIELTHSYRGICDVLFT